MRLNYRSEATKKKPQIVEFRHMKFRTELTHDNPSCLRLDPSRPIALIGSCFAANIASRMREHLWNAVNPFGALYNPESIRKIIRMSADSCCDKATHLHEFEAEGIWHSWMLDSSFSADSAAELARRFKTSATDFIAAISCGRHLCVTFGTAWVYSLSDSSLIVGNCHKQPASLFSRRRLTVDEISEKWLRLIDEMTERWPGLEILFTVSPVRHLKDGFEGNARSKAILLLAVEAICASRSNCHYFPAYELLLDDLRDYRFYANDLTHPSALGVDYIWEKLKASYIDDSGEAFLKEGYSLNAGLRHRPIVQAGPAAMQRETERRIQLDTRLTLFLDRYPHALSPRQ